MLYYVGTYLQETVDALSYLRLLDSISFRAIAGAITSLVFTILFGGQMILYFYRSGQRDASRQYAHFPVTEHQAKTYGGGLLVAAILISTLLWCKLHNPFVIICLSAVVWFFCLGYIDDFLKVRHGSSDRGLGETAKLCCQLVYAITFAFVFRIRRPLTSAGRAGDSALHSFLQEPGHRPVVGIRPVHRLHGDRHL